MKTCNLCSVTKPLSGFRQWTEKGETKTRGRCLECENRLSREGAKRRRANAGRESRTTEYIICRQKRGTHICWLKDRGRYTRQPDSLWEKNARQAWQYWLKTCPDWWVEQYYQATGKPWNNPRLNSTDKYRIRYQLDNEFQIKERLRRQIKKKQRRDGIADIMRNAIKRDGRSTKVEQTLGYTIQELSQHLERQFTKRMTWDAFMRGEIHIDHIIPQSEFNLGDDEEYRACWALPNLQPLWAKDNIAKSNKVMTMI